jgi:hypothetical protein
VQDPEADGGAAAASASQTQTPDLTHYITLSEAAETAFSAIPKLDSAPKTLAEAMKRDDADQWFQAAKDEIQAHIDNGTWEYTQLPPDRKAIGSRWVFKIKRNVDGSIDRYKGRLVAKGYSQRPGIDFDEVFSPTAKWAALRTILAQAALEGAHIESVDISNAYLNGVLDEEIEVFMEQPEGFHQGDDDWVCRLRKGLYGLKQSGRLWYEKLGKTLEEMGFVCLKSDSSVYVWIKDEVKITIPVFVDDLTITSKSKDKVEQVITDLGKVFKLRRLGPTSFLLGVSIEYDREQRTLSLSQRQYILDMLHRFKMEDCKPVSTPMDPGSRLSSTTSSMSPSELQAEAEEMKSVPYINAVGALNYLAIATRPDISQTVSKLARYNANPRPAHWKAVKHLFRYLQGTKDLKLTYAPSESNETFSTYVDADHGGDVDNGRSTTGFVIKMGTGAISWSSKLQTIVALSTTEAEYVAAVSAGAEIIWLRKLLGELGCPITSASTLHMDNQSAIAVAKNPEHHGRMKHLDLRFFWLRDAVTRDIIKPKYIPTADMPADILTKALPRAAVEIHRRMMGLI